jgi:FixJ family two-component response regulator
LCDQFQVKTFLKPEDFISAMCQNKNELPFDIVLTDLKMPHISGLEMLKKLHELGKSIPSVLLSGYLEKDVCVQASGFRVYRLLEKPSDLTKIVNALNEAQEISLRQIRYLEMEKTANQIKEGLSSLLMIVETRFNDDSIKESLMQFNGMVAEINDRILQIKKLENF